MTAETVNPPDDADLQRLEALQRDLQAAIDRAVHAGAKPVDVLTCHAMAFGAAVANMQGPQAVKTLWGVFANAAETGYRVERARLAHELADRREGRVKAQVYGGEARRRRG